MIIGRGLRRVRMEQHHIRKTGPRVNVNINLVQHMHARPTLIGLEPLAQERIHQRIEIRLRTLLGMTHIVNGKKRHQ